MALRFAFSSEQWRSPLRLIDSLLPLGPELNTRLAPPTTAWGERFAQAGWLGRAHMAPPSVLPASTACNVGRYGSVPPGSARLVVHSHAKGLRISGRVADVCAELDRLAQQEALQAAAVRH